MLGGGKKIIPDDLERSYGGVPEIAEIAVLEDKGALVALVRPEPAKLRDRGVTNLRDGMRIILGDHLLAPAQHEDLFHSPGDEEETVAID